jgi:hypothetical protein
MVSMEKDAETASLGGNGRGIRFESVATKVSVASVTLTTSAAMPMRCANTSTLTVIDGDGDDASVRAPAGGNGSGDIDMRHDPAAEHIAVYVGARRLGHDAQHGHCVSWKAF